MLPSVFVCGVLAALLTPARCELIEVCIEDDDNLRVDCRVKAKANQISSYEFSWSSGSKESLINANVSGLPAESQFRGKSEVTELEPHGYRMTLKGFTDTLPHNTTYLCKITGAGASVTVEKDQLVRCCAVSLILQNCWSVGLLLFFHVTHA
ncbi:thy-1 membrane glycoprotein-like [Entelurus aequoreus]|uniref:thy-1 membrane glycoprotein-like n=1 Tax=Entelurus aequoreus TaxID=161455 RepID=UPI002B1D2D9A|nr:thy-1 membrane glycoprotein-like [Entelurus aequoreus]XP_061902117.1 thy-1 membrane glycoprotein-like [Entelurus aequoreus]